MDESTQPVSMVLCSGTDDRLSGAAVLAAGAAAMERPVKIFLQNWALDAFRKDRITADHGASPEAGPEGAALLRAALQRGAQQHWSDVLRQAKEIGEVSIYACALSMDLLGLSPEDLDPLVDGVQGVATFMMDATGAIMFV